MSELKDYQKLKFNEYINSESSYGATEDEVFDEGFDTAIALELPIKFAVWVESKPESYRKKDREFWEKNGRHMIMRELWEYWIDNIYKPE